MTNININEIMKELSKYKIDELVGVKEFYVEVLQKNEISTEDQIKIMALIHLIEEELKRIEKLFMTTPQPRERYIH